MFSYETIFSKRKTLAIEVKSDGSVVVRAPFDTSKKETDAAVLRNTEWIEKAKQKMKSQAEKFRETSPEEEKILREMAKTVLPGKVKYFSALIGVTPTRITITGAKTCFGSCSGKNAISFSFYLMLLPEEAIDYVVVHELCHIIHHNHSKEFYKEIEKILPDYKERKKLLKGF